MRLIVNLMSRPCLVLDERHETVLTVIGLAVYSDDDDYDDDFDDDDDDDGSE